MAKPKEKNNGKYKDYVPYNKSSKKEKRKRDNEKRNTWSVPPVPKVEPDKKKDYDRKKKRRKDDYYNEDYDY